LLQDVDSSFSMIWCCTESKQKALGIRSSVLSPQCLSLVCWGVRTQKLFLNGLLSSTTIRKQSSQTRVGMQLSFIDKVV
jgi:hypothetical protein